MLDSAAFIPNGGSQLGSHARRAPIRHQHLGPRQRARTRRRRRWGRTLPGRPQAPPFHGKGLLHGKHATLPHDFVTWNMAHKCSAAFTTCQQTRGNVALHHRARLAYPQLHGAAELVFLTPARAKPTAKRGIKAMSSKELDWYKTRTRAADRRHAPLHRAPAGAPAKRASAKGLKKVKQKKRARRLTIRWMTCSLQALRGGHHVFAAQPRAPRVGSKFLALYITYEENGKTEYRALSRQLVMFFVERRKSWRMLQSKAGIKNRELRGAEGVAGE